MMRPFGPKLYGADISIPHLTLSGRFATLNPLDTEAILTQIGEERERQDITHGAEQNLPDGTGFGATRQSLLNMARFRNDDGRATWATVLEEEFYEALLETDPAKLRAELIQTAAVCVKWIEALDRRERVNAWNG